MTTTEAMLLRRIYDLERQQAERSYARDHSFGEWLEWFLRACER